MRLEQKSLLRVAFVLTAALLVLGCGDHDGATRLADAGSEGDDQSPPDASQPAAEATVELAPSGAEVLPAETVMSSGNYQMVGSLSVSSGQTSASESFELRPAPLELRLRTR